MAVHIQQAASEVFYGFSREEELTNFNTGVFLGLPWLDYLDVSFNFISNVTSGVFSGLPALATLDMGYNSLTTVRVCTLLRNVQDSRPLRPPRGRRSLRPTR